jgi:hypothetical protein
MVMHFCRLLREGDAENESFGEDILLYSPLRQAQVHLAASGIRKLATKKR